jgi:hypothetical protein
LKATSDSVNCHTCRDSARPANKHEYIRHTACHSARQRELPHLQGQCRISKESALTMHRSKQPRVIICPTACHYCPGDSSCFITHMIANPGLSQRYIYHRASITLGTLIMCRHINNLDASCKTRNHTVYVVVLCIVFDY